MDQPEERFDILRRIEDLSLAKLEELTGIDQKRWGTVKRRAGKMRAEEIQALCKAFPEYTMWIASGEEQADAGQISPMTKLLQK